MKNKVFIIFLVLVAVFCCQQAAQAGWSTQTSGTANDIDSIDFYNSTNGVFGSTPGYTTDGGETWSIGDDTAGIDVSMGSTSYVWGAPVSVGYYLSTDGGVNYSLRSTGIYSHSYGMKAVSADYVYSVGEGLAYIIKTTNGTSGSPTFASVSTDTSMVYADIDCYGTEGSHSCVAVGQDWSSQAHAVWKSTGASSFTASTTDLTSIYALYDVSFADANTVYAVGAVTNGPLLDPVVIKSTDGGNNWTTLSTGVTSARFYGVDFVDANTGWVVGSSGKIYSTSNGGSTWTQEAVGMTANDLNSVDAISAGAVWVAGDSGTILHFSDSTAPTFSSISASPDPAKAGSALTISFTASEALASNPTVTVDGNAATYVSVDASYNYVYSYTVQGTETEGAVTISISGTDTGGNTGTGSGSVTFDFTAPTTTASPAGGSYDSAQTVTLSTGESGTTTYYSTDGSTPTTTYSTPLTLSTSTTLAFYSVDVVGNAETAKTEQYIIQTDSTVPTFSNLSPADGATNVSRTKPITFTLTDTESGVDISSLTSSISSVREDVIGFSTSSTSSGSSYAVTLTPTSNYNYFDTYTVSLTYEDVANNQGSTSFSFTTVPADEPSTKRKVEKPILTEKKSSKRVKKVDFDIQDLQSDGTKELVTVPEEGLSMIKILSRDGNKITLSFLAYPKSYHDGVNFILYDINQDYKKEIITAQKKGDVLIKVFRKGKLLKKFKAFQGKTANGAHLAAGDVNQDNQPEIVAISNTGLVEIYNLQGKRLKRFEAFDYSPRSTAIYDLTLASLDQTNSNQSSQLRIITAETDPGAQIKIFNSQGKRIKKIISPYGAKHQDGLVFKATDINADNKTELITGTKRGSSLMKIYRYSGKLIKSFSAFKKSYNQGVDFDVANLHGQANKEKQIIVSSQGQSPQISFYSSKGKKIRKSFYPFGQEANDRVRIKLVNIKRGTDLNQPKYIVTALINDHPLIKIFNHTGTKVAERFYAY